MAIDIKNGTFEEALKFALLRKAVVPDEYYSQLPRSFRNIAFTVAGIEKQSQIKIVLDALKKVGDERGSFKDFKSLMAKMADPMKMLGESRKRLVYRNFTRTHFSEGRLARAKKNADRRPFARFVALSNARPSHRALHGTIVRVGDPILVRLNTPIAHNCRCRWVFMTAKQADRFGGLTPKAKIKEIMEIGVMVDGVEGLVKGDADPQFVKDPEELAKLFLKRSKKMPSQLRDAARRYEKLRKDDVDAYVRKKVKKFDTIVTNQESA